MLAKMNTATRQVVFDKINGMCFYCVCPLLTDSELALKVKGEAMQIDHIIPASRGGLDSIENYNPACSRCNCQKGNKTIEEYRTYLFFRGEQPNFINNDGTKIRDWLLVYGPFATSPKEMVMP